MHCIHRYPACSKQCSNSSGPKPKEYSASSPISSCCRLASTLAQRETPTTPAACAACILTERPMGLNTVTASLAYAANPDPSLINLFNELNQTVYNRPGSALRNLFQELGIFEGKACQCDEYAALMDTWGTVGCEARIPEIVAHLKTQEVTWFDILKVALGGYLTVESLVKKAIQCSKLKNN